VRGWTEKKNGEKGVEVGGWWLLFSGPVARAGRKKGAGGVSGVRRCVEEKMEQRGGGVQQHGLTWHGCVGSGMLQQRQTAHASRARLRQGKAAGVSDAGAGG
jgi:hypothetical protein